MCAKARGPDQTCEAWQLLLQFSFSQRCSLPAVAAGLALSPAQCHLLHFIEPDHEMPMGQLAGALSCDASNVTGLVDRLEQRGLLQRRPSNQDRRVKVLSLTPLGVRLRTAMLERLASAPPTLDLSDADRRTLVRILRRLLE